MPTVDLSVFGIQKMDMPPETGSCSGRLLIVASGRCVWDDLEALGCVHVMTGWEKVRFDGDIMAVNDMGMHLPAKVKHWYSNDGDMLPRWLAARRPEFARHIDGENRIMLHSFRTYGHHGIVKWPWPGHGGSGLNSVYTALGLGYDEVIITGMPSDNSGHYFDPPWVRTNFENMIPNVKDRDYNRWWHQAKVRIFGGRVTAVSGRPAQWLGKPKEML